MPGSLSCALEGSYFVTNMVKMVFHVFLKLMLYLKFFTSLSYNGLSVFRKDLMSMNYSNHINLFHNPQGEIINSFFPKAHLRFRDIFSNVMVVASVREIH